jgi:transcription elongation factor Elf1
MALPIDSKYVRLISSRLRNFKQKGDYLWNFSCPLCGDSKTNLSKARGYVFQKGNNLFYRCHNCGAGTNISNLLKNVDPSLHDEYVMERYKSGETNRTPFKPTFNVPTFRFDKLDKTKTFEHAEWCDKLPEGHFCLTYLRKRQIPEKYYKMLLFTSTYKKFVDALVPNHGKTIIDDARLVIPYYDTYNTLIAVSGRALETSDKTLRYVTIRTDDSEDKLVYGLDRLNKNELAYVVEGPLDSLFLDNCIASGDANLLAVAEKIDAKKILIFDNEPRNKDIVKLLKKAIDAGQEVVIWPNNIVGKDINEMILNGLKVKEIISSNSFTGLEALTKFTFWKKV